MLLRNYIDSNVDLSKIIRTQINLKPLEFDSYVIGLDTTITFTLKEFRALLAFAEALNLPLQLHFETTGKPAVFIVHNGATFEAHFVLATSKPDCGTQASSTQNTAADRRKRKDQSKSKLQEPSKKPHLAAPDADISKCLDEDSHLFNFIDIPEDVTCIRPVENGIENKTNNHLEAVDCDNIPGSPTSRTMINSVFKRCFESTYDPRSVHGVVLADNSDSE